MDVLDDLAFRGYIFQMTDEDRLRRRLAEGQMTLYCGFDPTADSLHAGSLVPIMGLRRFQDAGHKPIALVGGGTGLIGDPSGKAEERQLNSLEVVQAYTERQRVQLEKYLDFETGHNQALMVSNYTWLSELRTIEFLRDVGKHFSMGYMLGKESVSSRLSTGISFTEFSYMVLQAYDFMELKREYGCELQIGGSDQWGNITAGIELCRRVLNKTVYGLTFPLLEKSDGTKVWQDRDGNVMARSREDIALSVLSVLGECSRSRCGEIFEVVHFFEPRTHRGVGTRGEGATREARGAARAGRRGDDFYPRCSRKGSRCAYFRGVVLRQFAGFE